MQKVALYARSNTIDQKDKSHTSEQLKTLRQYAKENNYQVVGEYVDEGQSGSHLLRPGLVKLRKDMEKKKFETVITKDVARLSRQVLDYNILRSLFKKHNIKVVYTDYPTNDSPQAELMESMFSLFSEFESRMISDRIKRGLKQRSIEQNNKNLPSLEAKERFLETK